MTSKVTLLPNGLASFIPVRKGNWAFKVSLMKSKQILIIAQHLIDRDFTYVKYFTDETAAATFLENLSQEK